MTDCDDIHNEDFRELKHLLSQWSSGDRTIEADLLKMIYPVLRKQANINRRKHAAYLTMRTTEIANEAYLQLANLKQIEFENKTHFFALTAKLIRQMVIDHMRKRSSQKRGGSNQLFSLDSSQQDFEAPIDGSIDWIGIDQVLLELEQEDSQCAQIVELRFFSGLTSDEIATICDCAPTTVHRKWRFAKAWLAVRMSQDKSILES